MRKRISYGAKMAAFILKSVGYYQKVYDFIQKFFLVGLNKGVQTSGLFQLFVSPLFLDCKSAATA